MIGFYPVKVAEVINLPSDVAAQLCGSLSHPAALPSGSYDATTVGECVESPHEQHA